MSATTSAPSREIEGGASPPPLWRSWVGGALVATGVACGAVALAADVRPSRGGLPGLALFGGALAAVALAGVVVLTVRAWVEERRTRRWQFSASPTVGTDPSRGPSLPGSDGARPTGRPAAGGQERATRRRWALAALILAALAAAYVWWQVSIDVDGGLPTRALPLLGAGLVVVAAGCALLVFAPTDVPVDRPAPGRRAGVALGAGVAGAVVAVAGAGLVERRPLDTTTAAPADPPPVEVPTKVAWTWELPAGQSLGPDDVVPAGAGVAVRTEDGVVALDGRTGAERWHHRRSGARTTQIGASPSGRWVMATFESSSPDADGVRVVALDGQTGEVGFDEVSDGGALGAVRTAMTDNVLLGVTGDEGTFAGYDLADGRRRWEWRAPDDCIRSGTSTEDTAADTVLFAMTCVEQQDGYDVSGDVVLLAIDDRTGDERWRYTVPFATRMLEQRGGPDEAQLEIGAQVLASRDGSAAELLWHVAGEDAYPHLLVDAASGEELVAAEDMPARMVAFDRTGVLTIDSAGVGARYTLRSLPGGAEQTIDPPECGAGRIDTSQTRVADAFAELCLGGARDDAATVSVVPWADPDRSHTIEVDLGPYDEDAPVFDAPGIHALPAATVVVSSGRTGVVGLG